MRDEFDLDPGLIYLNSGTFSICPRAVLRELSRYQRDFERNPTAALVSAWTGLWETQQGVGAFFHADPHDLFLTPNVTTALNACILGLPLEAGSEILLTDLEYGAIANLCRFRAERDSLALRSLPLPSSTEAVQASSPQSLARAVLGAIGPSTRLLVLSHVVTGHGLRLPIETIARETRRRGVFLAVDGAHAPGAMELDFRKLADVDFYGGNLHKWMMGPKGTGFGWLASRHHDTLRPPQAGWTTYELPPSYASFAGSRHGFAARFLLSGCHDFAPFFALRETLSFWKRLTPAAILERLYGLQAALERRMSERVPEWQCISPGAGPLRGPLLAYRLPDPLQSRAPELARRLLLDHGIQVAVPQIAGKYHLRISPHIYNTEDELERAVEVFSRIARRGDPG